MTGRDAYKIWAPFGVKWSAWVRPVPFISINNEGIKKTISAKFIAPEIMYINNINSNTAIIVDIPDYDSVEEGVALAKIGFRPIPIYNGTNEQVGAIPTVNNHEIDEALIWGAVELDKITINSDAMPAFLLDSNRMHRLKMDASIFDNSWDIYAQDMPTAKFFLENGINQIIVRTEEINKDLNKILYDFQKAGIKILFTKGFDEPKEIIIKKSNYKN